HRGDPRAAASAGGPGSSVVLVITFERATRSSSGSPRRATGRPVLICSKRRLGPVSRTAGHSRTVPRPGNGFRRITGASPTQYLARNVFPRRRGRRVVRFPRSDQGGIMASQITPYLLYEDGAAAMDFIRDAFGFEEVLRTTSPEGRMWHGELRLGDDNVFVGEPGGDYRSPKQLGTTTVGIHVYVADVDAHFERAKAAGAEI